MTSLLAGSPRSADRGRKQQTTGARNAVREATERAVGPAGFTCGVGELELLQVPVEPPFPPAGRNPPPQARVAWACAACSLQVRTLVGSGGQAQLDGAWRAQGLSIMSMK